VDEEKMLTGENDLELNTNDILFVYITLMVVPTPCLYYNKTNYTTQHYTTRQQVDVNRSFLEKETKNVPNVPNT
jgi:hypothetical protein